MKRGKMYMRSKDSENALLSEINLSVADLEPSWRRFE